MKMKLIDDLIAAVSRNNSSVNDVRVGVSWTGVLGKYCGLAKTYGIPVVHGNYTRDMGRLTEKTTAKLAEYAKSWNLIEASIGVAAINSMIEPKGKTGINALDIILEKARDKNVTMIGSFPLIPEIRSVARELWVLELDPFKLNPKEGTIIETASDYVIPESDIIVITGSTLINKSMKRFLELASQGKAYTIILGPSTPMCEVLFDYGADMLAGVEITDPQKILLTISQSGGMITPTLFKQQILFRVMEK
jgi:uncharacterized protein (DUF4213/DUF364 family)